MKTKLLFFFGLSLGILSLTAITTPPTYAAGESYRWVDEATIEATGGSYNSSVAKNIRSGTTTRVVPVEKVTFTQDGSSGVYRASTENIFYTVQQGGSLGTRTCPLQLTLTFTAESVTAASLAINSPSADEQCEDKGQLGTGATITNEAVAPDPASFATQSDSETTDEDVSSCQIDGIGWILCPVMNFIGGITDQAYIAVQSLLETPPVNLDTNANPTYDAWQIMRNIANVAFVITFLIIIFSQLSNFGVSNYGIKKMLPRLVIAAILVNVSYFICALAVDVSNILGSSLKELFDNITRNFVLDIEDDEVAGIFNGDNKWVNIIGAVLAGSAIIGGIVLLHVSILLPILIAALAAIVTVVIVLTLRQALIIILIVISPLAFVAFLLPNTESLFNKWRALLTTLLLMYPIIAVIFGASAFAGTIIMNSAEGDNAVLVQIMGAGVTIIPLFITPLVMRTAGGLLNRFGGIINNPNKGVFDRMRKGSAGIRERGLNKMNNNAINNGGRFNPRRAVLRRRARVEAVDQNQQREFTRGKTGYIADATENNDMSTAQQILSKASGGKYGSGLRDQMAAGGVEDAAERALASAISVQAKLEAEEVTAGRAVIEKLNLDVNEKQNLEQGNAIIKNGTTYQGGIYQKAALTNAVAEQRIGDIEAAAISPNLGQAGAIHLSQSINNNYATVKSKAAHLVDGNNLHRLAEGKQLTAGDLDKATASAMKGMSAELMATQKDVSIDRIEDVARNINSGSKTYTASDTESLANIKSTAKTLRVNSDLYDKMGVGGKDGVERVSNL